MLRTTISLNQSTALLEAHRCLGCYQAPCTQACPVHVDVPGFISRFRENNLKGASELIYQACPLGHICGNACPTTTLCEGACVLQQSGQTAIRIGALQAFITHAYQPQEQADLIGSEFRVAVLGSGPAGIGCAVQLNRLGVKVDVYDRRAKIGGMVDQVIPAHRLPLGAVDHDLQHIRSSGIHFITDVSIDPQKASEILDSYDAVFLAFGMGGINSIPVPGMESHGTWMAMEFLEAARKSWEGAGEAPRLGRKVVVIGGGNVALDAAVVSTKLGADEVMVVYRRSKDQMPAWESEYLEACELGVEFRWLSVVDEIMAREGTVKSIKIGRMRLVEEQVGGRRWVERDDTQDSYEQACDNVIFALGQEFEPESAELFGIPVKSGSIQTINGSSQTINQKVFAGGEAVMGGSTIVACLAAGKSAGMEIRSWLERRGQH